MFSLVLRVRTKLHLRLDLRLGMYAKFAAKATKDKPNQAFAFLREFAEQQKPVGKGVSCFALDGGSGERRMINNGGGDVSHSIAMGEEPRKRIALFTDFKWGAAAKALVEKHSGRAGCLSQSHIGAEPQAAECRDFKPMRVFVAQGA